MACLLILSLAASRALHLVHDLGHHQLKLFQALGDLLESFRHERSLPSLWTLGGSMQGLSSGLRDLVQMAP